MFSKNEELSFSKDRENMLQQRKNELCAEMLSYLIDNNDVEIRINSPEYRNEISALLAGKWSNIDLGTSDIFSKKVLGTCVSDWSPKKIQGNAAIYKVRYDEDSTYNTWYAKQQSNALAKIALGVGIAAGIIGAASIMYSVANNKK